jgi:putative spermidine/putrescine transport system permease protein
MPPADRRTRMDKIDLARDFRRAERRRRIEAFLLVLPLLAFLVFAFVIPIGDMLRRAVMDPELSTVWPATTEILRAWDGRGEPPAAAWAALASDLKSSREAGNVAVAARRLNYPIAGGRSLVMNSSRRISSITNPPPDGWKAAFTAADAAWTKPETWIAMKRASGPATDYFLLAALDMRKMPDGSLAWAPAQESIYLSVLGRTLWIAALVTLVALALGYPLAYLISHSGATAAAVLIGFVMLPFWTSLLVRSAAWIVLLQEQGLLNKLLVAIGIVEKPLRLIFNRTGVVIAMVHVLLPFMVLPILAAMRSVRPETVRAARSLGAPAWMAFRRVYLPQTLPGVWAGCLLVFISALGYYITPALVGGADDQMLSYFIAFYTTETVNWGLAAALGVLLLATTAALGLVYAAILSKGARAT